MEPYYQDERITLYHGDCREVLAEIGPIFADMVIADPPYEQTSLEWDVAPEGWAPQVAGVLRPTGSVWCLGSLRSLPSVITDFARLSFHQAQDVIWEKHNGSSLAADRFRRVHEQVVQLYRRPWERIYRKVQKTNDATARTVRRKKRPAHWGNIGAGSYTSEDGGPRLQRSVIAARSAHGRARHPTEKPAGIVAPLLLYSCPPGGLIIDPFSGGGAVLLCARDLGFRAIGVELEEKYAEEAAERLREELPFYKERTR